MKTHIVYSKNKDKSIVYFSGIYHEDIDADGYAQVEWQWTHNKKDAIVFYTTDAWDLLNLARKLWPEAIIQIERIKTLEEIQTRFDRLSMDI